MVGSSQLLYKNLMAIAMLALLSLAGIEAKAAPGGINWSPQEGRVSYTAIGYSQVENKWPKSGVVCRHYQTTKRRTCYGLIPTQHYKIVDFADNRISYFQLPGVYSPLKPVICRAGSRGNLTNIRYGLSTKYEFFITWDRKRSPSWVQLQHENPRDRGIAMEGMGNIKTRLRSNVTYRLDDLTYGGRVYIDLKRNGC